jgi:hypothetical protein
MYRDTPGSVAGYGSDPVFHADVSIRVRILKNSSPCSMDACRRGRPERQM